MNAVPLSCLVCVYGAIPNKIILLNMAELI